MIGFLKGTLLSREENAVIIDVSGVGYEVHLASHATPQALSIGHEIALTIYTHVKEDALELFGFFSRDEKTLFLNLLKVSGIGPKTALSIVSSASVADLTRALATGNKALLSSFPGIGKKTAERMVLELKDKFEKLLLTGFGGSAHSTQKNHASVSSSSTLPKSLVLDAFFSLGYKPVEAERIIHSIEASSHAPATIEEWIRLALKYTHSPKVISNEL